ncbi:hypothetical protein D9M71_162310 [compost metagenome]
MTRLTASAEAVPCAMGMTNSAAPMVTSICVRNPADLPLASRSKPSNAPSSAASARRRLARTICSIWPRSANSASRVAVIRSINSTAVRSTGSSDKQMTPLVAIRFADSSHRSFIRPASPPVLPDKRRRLRLAICGGLHMKDCSLTVRRQLSVMRWIGIDETLPQAGNAGSQRTGRHVGDIRICEEPRRRRPTPQHTHGGPGNVPRGNRTAVS